MNYILVFFILIGQPLHQILVMFGVIVYQKRHQPIRPNDAFMYHFLCGVFTTLFAFLVFYFFFGDGAAALKISAISIMAGFILFRFIAPKYLDGETRKVFRK